MHQQPIGRTLRYGKYSITYSLRQLLIFALLCAVLISLILLSISQGTYPISLLDIFNVLIGEGSKQHDLLISHIRFPRILAGLLAGFCLGISGSILQTLSHNRLATPEILGVNAGATLLITSSLVLGTTSLLGPWWLAPIGALLAMLILLILAGELGRQGYSVLIIGLALSNFFTAIVELMMSRLNLQHATEIYYWRIGSLIGRGYDITLPSAALILLLIPCIIYCSRSLSVLRFQEEIASSLGVAVRKQQLILLLLAVILAGIGVGISGPLAFIALAAPILTQHLIGSQHVGTLLSGMMGASLAVGADLLSRTLVAPIEIPVGVMTSLLGGPFLLWVLLTTPEHRS